MQGYFWIIAVFLFIVLSCRKDEVQYPIAYNNPQYQLDRPSGFPEFNPLINENFPTKYGVELGRKLFHDVRLSSGNEISCASCHIAEYAYADKNPQAIGVLGRVGLRNAPPIQNMAFLKTYMWDGNILDLAEQPIVPIVSREEMSSSILEIIDKIKNDSEYKTAFLKAFGDETINGKRIMGSLAQYMYTLVSADSHYDRVMKNAGETFTQDEKKGFEIFNNKCASCHSGALFTDQTYRNIGFPENPNTTEEAGRARVTGRSEDRMKFRVPSLRNVEYTAPYGSFGQFATLREVLDYFDNGVKSADNLDEEMKKRTDGKLGIALTEDEKNYLIAFLKTLSDKSFISHKN